MEAFNETVDQLLIKYNRSVIHTRIIASVLDLIDKFHSNGFFHGDMHLKNIMVSSNPIYNPSPVIGNDVSNEEGEENLYNSHNYKYYLIDFDNSNYIKNGALPALDYCQLRDSLGRLSVTTGKSFIDAINLIINAFQRSPLLV